MSSFFLTGDSARKKPGGRKRVAPSSAAGRGGKKTLTAGEERVNRRRKRLEAEEISSDSGGEKSGVESDNEEFLEDVNQRAFRKASELLKKLRADKEGEEAEEVDDSKIAHALREDADARAGRLHRKVADSIELDDDDEFRHRGHRFSVTSVAVSPCGRYAISSGKEATIVKYDMETKKVVGVISPRTKKDKEVKTESACILKGHIFAVAVSTDGKYIASGGQDTVLRIWDFNTLVLVKELKGHRGSITALAFRSNSSQLFSASHDRSIRLWDCDQLGFVDTMFGHQDEIVSLSALSRERVLSGGGRDRSLRLWKVAEESQLVFNGPTTCMSIECVTMINEDHFASGSSDGSLCLWSVMKKRATCVVQSAHGREEGGEPRWIVSLFAIPYTDLLLSGSSDGQLRVWRVAEDYRTLTQVYSYEVDGFINSIAFSSATRTLVLGIGQEHRFGRWWKVPQAKNSVLCLPIRGLDSLPTDVLAQSSL